MARQGPPPAREEDESALVEMLRHSAEHLPAPEDEAFGAFFDRFAGARVVLLGEATHGSSEFYRARAAISRRLIERHGFNIVAVEADWPDASRIDRFVRHREPELDEERAFSRFPTWMWRNREVHDFISWLRRHNEGAAREDRAEFRGLDVYSLGSSMRAVLDYLDRVDPEAAREARSRYRCLTPWQSDPVRYGRAVLMGRQDCEDEAVQQLTELLDRRLEDRRRDPEGWLDAAQNARIVRAAEQYYRLMYRGSTESWNLRDRHMFETLRQVMQVRGPDARAIVWAHNSHIGNASATAMGWQGEFNVGELCRNHFGEEAALIGFGTDRGTVAAADDWDEPMRVKTVLPARDDSYEALFRRTGIARSLTDLRVGHAGNLREALSPPRLERAIGVVYRPETELASHYFRCELPQQFDAYVWFEQTRAVTPLGNEVPEGVLETYPFGV
ncbi:Erythromycin esterase homolog [Faunimonas pinastri]|uniref:Erythromycin esterase homolog n=1 Tax=Faunimonas pinastri TaxID=1855383 RepID=A0A1H9A6Q7_9HYPH|nr:erythromycin esterase family protein [Faunimonas pinastri]SEP71658.1 Erythromycin esterase homolog [Faunimonas pinastri]